jgi:hypothetical protein
MRPALVLVRARFYRRAVDGRSRTVIVGHIDAAVGRQIRVVVRRGELIDQIAHCLMAGTRDLLQRRPKPSSRDTLVLRSAIVTARFPNAQSLPE